VTSRWRLVAPALVALALSPGGLAFAESADNAGSAGAPPPALRPLMSLARPWVLTRDSALLRPPAVHPVDAPADYGDEGARYGAGRAGHAHEGQDVFAPAGTPLLAVRDGVVLEAGEGGGRGYYVGIWSPEARETYVYLHLLEPAPVASGQHVRRGQRVGRLGCTGSCFGDHLHFEVRRGKGLEAPSRDPLQLLHRWPRA
jgi:murein DD-endopeptidase MepM/ murein hydrolase activator NlpD